MNKWIHKQTENYTVELETTEDNKMFLHVQVHNWNKCVYKEMIETWLRMEELLKDSGYYTVYGVLPVKNERFASMFGFELHKIIDGYTIVSKEI